jgi:hypothetical protein
VAAQDAHGDFRIVEEIIHHHPDPGLSFPRERFECWILQDSRHFLGGRSENFCRGNCLRWDRQEGDNAKKSKGQGSPPAHIHSLHDVYPVNPFTRPGRRGSSISGWIDV